MPSLQPLTLGTVTMTPVNVDRNNVAQFRDQASGVPAGYPSMMSSVTEPSKGSQVYRVKLQFAKPRLNQFTEPGSSMSTTRVEGIARCHLEFILPSQGTEDERTELIDLVRNALADINVQKTVLKLEHFY